MKKKHKRKSPSRHKVRNHKRRGRDVRSYVRGIDRPPKPKHHYITIGHGKLMSNVPRLDRDLEKLETRIALGNKQIDDKYAKKLGGTYGYGRVCLVRSAVWWKRLKDQLKNLQIAEGTFGFDSHTWLTFTHKGKKYILDTAQPPRQRPTDVRIVKASTDKRYKQTFVVDDPETYEEFAAR